MDTLPCSNKLYSRWWCFALKRTVLPHRRNIYITDGQREQCRALTKVNCYPLAWHSICAYVCSPLTHCAETHMHGCVWAQHRVLDWQGCCRMSAAEAERCRRWGQASAPAVLDLKQGSAVRETQIEAAHFKFSQWVSSSLPLLLFYDSPVTYHCTAAGAAIRYVNCALVGHRCNRCPAAANVCFVIWRYCPLCT